MKSEVFKLPFCLRKDNVKQFSSIITCLLDHSGKSNISKTHSQSKCHRGIRQLKALNQVPPKEVRL